MMSDLRLVFLVLTSGLSKLAAAEERLEPALGPFFFGASGLGVPPMRAWYSFRMSTAFSLLLRVSFARVCCDESVGGAHTGSPRAPTSYPTSSRSPAI